MKVWLVLACALSSTTALAADRWIQKRNPEEFYAYIDVYECPISVDELEADVHAMMIRSRIRPLTEWDEGDIVLYIALDCASEDDAHWVFELSVMLAKLRKERGDVVISFRHEDQFGAFGKGGRELIQRNVDKAVDAAFMKYLKANFDLEPGGS